MQMPLCLLIQAVSAPWDSGFYERFRFTGCVHSR